VSRQRSPKDRDWKTPAFEKLISKMEANPTTADIEKLRAIAFRRGMDISPWFERIGELHKAHVVATVMES
jgi:hypothetical protein